MRKRRNSVSTNQHGNYVLEDAKVERGTYDQYTAASAGIVRLVMLNEVQSLLLGHHVDVADPVLVCHTIYLISHFGNLWPECGRDELSVSHVS